jgi:hypothetical protein
MLYACLFGIVLPIIVAILFGRAVALLAGHKVAVDVLGLVIGLVIGLLLSK